MFQETRAQHLRARNAADKGEESMTGMRFFANLIPEALKHRPRESRAASRFSREPHSLTISLSLSESTSREMEDRGQTKRERQAEKAYEKERKNESSSSTVGRGRKREREREVERERRIPVLVKAGGGGSDVTYGQNSDMHSPCRDNDISGLFVSFFPLSSG